MILSKGTCTSSGLPWHTVLSAPRTLRAEGSEALKLAGAGRRIDGGGPFGSLHQKAQMEARRCLLLRVQRPGAGMQFIVMATVLTGDALAPRAQGPGRLSRQVQAIATDACATCRVVYDPSSNEDLLWLGCDSCSRCGQSQACVAGPRSAHGEVLRQSRAALWSAH